MAVTYARRLGLFSATMSVIGGIIGSGIFLNPSIVAQRVGTSASTLAVWIGGGVVALIGAFIFGELGQRRPRVGGGYSYIREAFGPLPAFLYAWTLLLMIAPGATAAVAVAFGNYTTTLLNVSPSLARPLGVGAILLLTLLNCLGVTFGAITQNIFTLLKLAAIAMVVVAGLGAIGHPIPPCVDCAPLPVISGAGAMVGRRRRGAGAGALLLRWVAADQLHRRGDHRAREEPAEGVGAGRDGGGTGVRAGQRGLSRGRSVWRGWRRAPRRRRTRCRCCWDRWGGW